MSPEALKSAPDPADESRAMEGTATPPAAAIPAAPPSKPKAYRCQGSSYTIPAIMCIGRQQSGYALCPKCQDRAPLPTSALPPPNPN